ncbi:hypothetical protein [Mesorhizobium sp.]|uniref:hypothetical protein n=1 Tax=Mesorhizobium sp. TaxID=1871066 RepID=UPI000FE82D9D|nr:hypothetical protein [Mesorhizobium sp.]RWE65180.1 MAG: hypothetical protein EOS62_25885 [Mesorhizobium sp.]
MTDGLAHHSFSLKRQQIIKPCRAQLDRAAFNAIGTVFNTFWPQLATGFLDLCRIVLSFQAICRIGIAAGRSDLKVRLSGVGFETLPLSIGPDDDRAQASPSQRRA